MTPSCIESLPHKRTVEDTKPQPNKDAFGEPIHSYHYFSFDSWFCSYLHLADLLLCGIPERTQRPNLSISFWQSLQMEQHSSSS